MNRRIGTPPPVKGRVHVQVQTVEKYEDLYDELMEREMKMKIEFSSMMHNHEEKKDDMRLENHDA